MTLPASPLTKPRSRTVRPSLEQPPADALELLAWWLDSAIVVPGTRFRVGLDALIGLVPGIGDLIGAALSAYIVAAAARRGLPRSVLFRMALNVGLEALVGVVPIVGDLFDAAWKANQRNVALLSRAKPARRRQLAAGTRRRRGGFRDLGLRRTALALARGAMTRRAARTIGTCLAGFPPRNKETCDEGTRQETPEGRLG